ncbi:MAG: stress response translation initiation inhibitor YciH [Candidatus Nanoarchaeia archaeon]|jgi:translation initiation factor 1
MSVCSKCGLPKELCTCSQLILEEQVAKVETAKRRYGKPVTIIRGINFEELGPDEVKDLIKILKKKLACGGTYDKDNKWVELQGSHKNEVMEILIEKGFKVEGYESKRNDNNGDDDKSD